LKDHKEIFTKIYADKVWGDGSGGGSTLQNTVEYRELLQKFLKDYKIKSVVDYGCGVWMFSQLIDWKNIRYQGIDCVESVIIENKRLHEVDNISFSTPVGMRIADLMILKDVLQQA